MGDRSWSIYVRSPKGKWTPVAVGDGADLDPGALAAGERADVVQVWFDDDAGVTVQVAGADGFAGELSVPLADDGGSGAEDERFIDALAGRKLLTTAGARTLKSRLQDPPAKRDAWVLGHGLEKAFKFPPAASAPARTAAAPARAPYDHDDNTAPVPRRHRLPEEARPTIDLHVFYWTDVWSMNSWTLANRYKKHLPAADRRQVDELCNAVALGNTREIPNRVERILTQTWQAEDWAAFIRNPKLDDDGTGEATLRRWRAMTGRG